MILSATFSLLEVDYIYLFLILLPIVSLLYSAVGHGGASGYLAMMALFSFPSTFMKPAALSLNILVSGLAFYYFWRNGHFKWKLFYPFAITSIPASFIGGYLSVDATTYKLILGVLLLATVARMLFIDTSSKTKSSSQHLWLSLIIGASIGFFSGMIGIGGGIILSPVILLLGWANLKETAAVSALFIWVNSISGMTGLMASGTEISKEVLIIAAFAVVGGLIGGYLGSKKLNNSALKYLLSVVLLLAAIKLLLV